jgi:hypothetical protein
MSREKVMEGNFEYIWERIRKECRIKNMAQLAEILRTSQGNVSKKKKTKKFPPEWGFEIAQKYNLSTDWIMTGKGPKKLEGEVHESYLVMLEQWLKEYTAPDPRKKALFELTIEREFPEFKEWLRKKTGENEDNVISRVA